MGYINNYALNKLKIMANGYLENKNIKIPYICNCEICLKAKFIRKINHKIIKYYNKYL